MKSQTELHGITTQKFVSRMKSFQVFFLRDGENQTVEVIETNNLDCEELNRHLEFGESIFIIPKKFISNTKTS